MASKISQPRLLVDARWFQAHRRDRVVMFVDTRPADDYWKGHIKGARHFDPFPFHYTNTDERGTGEFRAQLELIFSAIGITGRETVVFYENDSGMRAARATWLLEWMGHKKSRMLDGGLNAIAGEKLTDGPPTIKPWHFRGKPCDEVSASAAYLIESLGRPDVQIFDVRSDEEYFGERVRAKRGGAIPGAVHRDWTAANTPDGYLKPARQLRAEFEALGLRPNAEIVPYCQGGYRAAHAYIALKQAGYPRVRNYWGSWAEWGNREEVPIEHPVRHN
jgi:thiosulfate/3-mercaptopyruvate sulfurtransferase